MEKLTKSLTPKMMLELAAPHTWAASVTPVLLAAACAYRMGASLSLPVLVSLLLVSILMQSAVNTLNDYFDFVRGTDGLDDGVEPTDQVLVYNDVEPAQVLRLGLVFLAIAACISIVPLMAGGLLVLLIGLLGGLTVVLYSAGPQPISSLPIGEFVSGVVMGILISSASLVALRGAFDSRMLAYALPLALSIALLMMTNNLCDIERDLRVKRYTLPARMGHEAALQLYRVLLCVLALGLVLLALTMLVTSEHAGARIWLLVPIVLLCFLYGVVLYRQMALPLVPACRPQAMNNSTHLVWLTGLISSLCLCL